MSRLCSGWVLTVGRGGNACCQGWGCWVDYVINKKNMKKRALNLINRKNIRSSSRFLIAQKLAWGQAFWQGRNRRILLLEHQKSAGWALVNKNSTRVISVNQFRRGFRSGTLSALAWALSGIPAMFECAFLHCVLACPPIHSLICIRVL